MKAQQKPDASMSPALSSDLQRIGQSATELMKSMPSFTCDETAVSEALRDGKVVRVMNLSGTVRGIRQKDGRISETNDIKRQHTLAIFTKYPPVFVSGGFSSALGSFLPSAQVCYSYSLSPALKRRIDYAALPAASAPKQCKDHGLKGYVLLDAEGNVTHIERTVPVEVAKPFKVATYASIDLAPVELSGRTFQLSRHMIAEMPLSQGVGHFDATYTNCHQFATTVTLGASSEVQPDSKPQ